MSRQRFRSFAPKLEDPEDDDFDYCGESYYAETDDDEGLETLKEDLSIEEYSSITSKDEGFQRKVSNPAKNWTNNTPTNARGNQDPFFKSLSNMNVADTIGLQNVDELKFPSAQRRKESFGKSASKRPSPLRVRAISGLDSSGNENRPP